MTRQASLFDTPPQANPPIRQPDPETSTRTANVNTARPAGWRAPTLGEHVCHGCAGAACYGEGTLWFCMDCVPDGFLPSTRGRP